MAKIPHGQSKRTEANIKLRTDEKERFDQARATLASNLGKRVSQATLIEALIDIAYESMLGTACIVELAHLGGEEMNAYGRG